MLSKCCWGCRLKDEEWHYLKAQDRINYEFDIEHLIKNVRLLKNAFKFLTTKRERCLVRMQADKNLIVVREEDKKVLLGDVKKELVDDSSDFFSEEYESYVKELHQSVNNNRVQLTDRESQLLSGIGT